MATSDPPKPIFDRLSFNETTGELLVDGKPVVTRQKLKFNIWQTIGAVIITISALIAGMADLDKACDNVPICKGLFASKNVNPSQKITPTEPKTTNDSKK